MEFSRLNVEKLVLEYEQKRKETEENEKLKIQLVSERPFIGDRNEAEPHTVYNDFIHKGYRINYKTWKAVFCSFFSLHNESVNVWTHAIGFLGAFTLLILFAFTNIPH